MTEVEVMPANPDALAVGDAAAPGQLKGRFQPNSWERFLSGQICCPCCACWTFFIIGIIFTMIFNVRAYREGENLFSFDEQPVKSDPIVQAWYAFDYAKGKEIDCFDKDHKTEAACQRDAECFWNSATDRCEEVQRCAATSSSRPRSVPIEGMNGRGSTWMIFLYEAQNDGNLLDDDILGYIQKFETNLLTVTNGAKNNAGQASPWDQDWCLMKYPSTNPSAAGRCMSVATLAGLFTMTTAARATVASQVNEGFSEVGSIAPCFCGDADTLCSICTVQNGEGEVMPFNQWPLNVRTCIMSRLASMPVSNSTSSGACGGGPGMSHLVNSPSAVEEAFRGYCKSQPSCQWSPAGTNWLCSSTGFYASDWQGLVTGAEKDAVLDKMCNENKTGWWNMRKQVLHQSFDCSARKAKFARTLFIPGNPTPGSAGFDAFQNKYVKGRDGWYASARKLESQIEKESGGKLRIILYSQATIMSQFLEILMFDMALSLLSMFMVWAYMWWTLESFFLASCAMFEIVFSVPVAMCLWTLVLQQKVIFTQTLVIYMILGIGADDAFILYDAWLQARFAGDEVMQHWSTRFAYAYRKSFHAMAITTATTCGSFLIGACSPLPMVRDFCIFAAVVVLVDWLFCVSFFASAVVVYERTFKNKVKKPGECCGGGCCWGGCRYAASTLCGKRCVDVDEDQTIPKKRGMERFCEGPLFNFLNRRKFVLLFSWLVIIALAIGSAAGQLRTAKKAAPVGREGLDVTRGIEILMSEFSFRGAPPVHFAWGIDTAQPALSWTDLEAEPNYSPIGRITTPAGQLELLHLCQAADLGDDVAATRCDSRKCIILGKSSTGRCPRSERIWRESGIYVPDDVLCTNGRHCFMEEFTEWWAATKDGCPGKTQGDCVAHPGCSWQAQGSGSGTGICYSATSPDAYPGLSEAEFVQSLTGANFSDYLKAKEKVLENLQRPFEVDNSRSMTGWKTDANGNLRLAWVGFNGTIPMENSLDEANTWYDRWEAFRITHSGSLGGYQTTDVYKFMVTQREMIKAALLGILLSLLVAYIVMMMTTMNWWVASLGMVNISAISANFLGVMPLLGWSFGENECIFLIAVVGLSVDYSVHLLHSYNHGAGGREERAKHALGEMGISVTNSAITTLLAAVILFGCGFYFFFQFGAFIFFVIGFSILMSITFLIPLLLVAGPRNGAGNFPCLNRKAAMEVKEIKPEELQQDEK